LTKGFFYDIRKVRLRLLKSKSNEVVKKAIKELRKVLEGNPNYCGSVIINFYKGGVTNIEKREIVKIK